LLPGIDAAEEFVDTVAPIRVGPNGQPRKAPVEIGTCMVGDLTRDGVPESKKIA
jgi:hypothetical protein